MKDFIQTGRVRFFSMCLYDFDSGRITTFLNKDEGRPVTVNRKVVDTTHNVRVPGSVTLKKPTFDVTSGVQLVPANELPRVMTPHPKYVIIGSGRTAMDSVLWLMSMGVKPSMMQWVVPRDHFCFCREAMTPDRYCDTVMTFQSLVKKAQTHEDLVAELERVGIYCHIHDDAGAPLKRKGPGKNLEEDTAFHGVQVSKQELAQLHLVTDIIRLGHVRAIHAEELVLEKGSVPQAQDTLYVDCTSTWLHNAPATVPIWAEKKITLQYIEEVTNGVGDFNICFQAALVGFIEAKYPDNTNFKNKLCTPSKPVDNSVDWLESQYKSAESKLVWTEKKIGQWMAGARPGLFAVLRPDRLRKLVMSSDIQTVKLNLARLLAQVQELRAAHAASNKKEDHQGKQMPSFSRQQTAVPEDEAADVEYSSDDTSDYGDLPSVF